MGSDASAAIAIDENRRVAQVTAGTPTRTFLNYLAAYKTKASPEGYTLPVRRLFSALFGLLH